MSTRTTRPSTPLLMAAVLAAAYAWLVFATTFRYPGQFGLNYNTPGTDFMVFHTAIRAALHGDAAILADGDRFTQTLNHLFADRLSAPLVFRPWVNPPGALLVMLPIAGLGFAASYALFMLASAAMFAAALCAGRGAPRGAAWVAAGSLLCPAAAICVLQGQVSFLVGAILIAGVRLLAARPALAGALWGLLSFKPQFVLMLPAAVLRRPDRLARLAPIWPAIAGGAAGAIGLTLLSAALFGPSVWLHWLAALRDSTSGADQRWLLYCRIWGHSVFTCATLLGAGPGLATAAQLAAVALAAAAVLHGFRTLASPALRTALLLAATLLAAPHWGGYDALMLTAATGLWLADAPQGRSLSAWLLGFSVWMMPLLGPPALNDAARFGPLLTGAVILAILRQPKAAPQCLPHP